MKVLITGGAGFIGSHLADHYVTAGYTVAVVDKQTTANLDHLKNQVTFFKEDITTNGMESVFSTFKPDIVNHHAALIHVAKALNKPTEYTKTNVYGTIALLELSKRHQVKQFLFASSVAVYGDPNTFPISETQEPQPDSFYGLDKYLAECYISLYDKVFTTTIFRYANVYGPRQTSSAEGGVVAIFAKALAAKKAPTIFGSGLQTRDFVYVKDVARANVMASQKGIGGTMHISTGVETSINSLYNILQAQSQSPLKPHYGDARPGDVPRSVLANQHASLKLSWSPEYSLEKGLKETGVYFQQDTRV